MNFVRVGSVDPNILFSTWELQQKDKKKVNI